ncbi:hypothetical protein [Enterobacter hormaechei]|uniref:hypothetical protein n=1 Tax=Enterobacter hormaechei TaxID=158836 RepID=UPI001981BECC|nr:hypothetical protein [Enterobacter hormaechei]MBN4788250.1 hypothetical protein [Enterobacter hormaechei]
MSIKNLVEMIKHNGLLASMAQLEKLYQVAIENEQKLSEFEARCAALAAENVGLKSAIEKHADSYIMCGYCRTERDGKNDDVCEVLDSIPATDALLAEVRAQGVEMFAAHKRERQQALRSRSMRMSEEAAGMAADAENFADELRKGVQS